MNNNLSYQEKKELTKNKVKIHQLINFDKELPETKVSIVVPVCNVETYLRECLDSIVNQTLKEIEIICVNDGSSDNSLSILEEYAEKDERVKIIDKDNAGYGHTMNIGMDMAKGEYIGIVESDDFVDLHMFEDLYKIAKEKNLDFIKADFNRFVKENGKLKCSYIDIAARAKDCYNKVIDPADDTRVFTLVMQTWSGIYKKDFLSQNGIRHHESPGASYQDNGFWFQTMMFAKRIYFYNKPYYYNRRDNPNSSVYNKAKVYCMNDEYKFIMDIMDKYPDLKEKYKYQYNRKKFLNYVFTYNRLAKEFKWEYLVSFNKELKEANEAGDIDWSLFNDKERKELEMILNDPGEYYNKIKADELKKKYDREIQKKNEQLKKLEIAVRDLEKYSRIKQEYIYDMWNSTSYKIGRGITCFGRNIKDHYLVKQKEASSNKIAHIVYITDEGYCMPTTVAMTSLKINKNPDSIYKVHIFASKISEDSRKRMMALNDESFIVDIIDVKQDERFKNYTKRDGDLHVTPAAILKFKIPVILDKVGKVLYMDGDVLVQDDILELYNTDLKGRYAAVVKDIISEKNPKHLKFLKYPYKYYFNSGMMLLNLTRMRKDKVTDKLVDYRLHGINHFMDQDTLNVVFGEKVLYVSPRYNFLNRFYEWWDPKKLSAFYEENLPPTEKAAFKKAVILHLGSHEKPWKYEMGYLSRLYDKYYKQSPYRDIPLVREPLPEDIYSKK